MEQDDIRASANSQVGIDELVAPAKDDSSSQRISSAPQQSRSPLPMSSQDSNHHEDYDGEITDEDEAGLDEVEAPAPEQNPDDDQMYRHKSLEEKEAEIEAKRRRESPLQRKNLMRYLHIYCSLIFFSIMGVLARLGLQALTRYPGAPVANTDLWANIAGCGIIGYLREDRSLYQRHWNEITSREKSSSSDAERSSRKALATAKASIPSYIGLAVGFCGSLTSFASICRDAFLAMANILDTASISDHATTPAIYYRAPGYSVMAILGVLILEVGLSIMAITVGAHVAILAETLTRDRAVIDLQQLIDTSTLVLGPGVWIGSMIMAIWPPYEAWRGEVLFALVFAPLGCILRYRLSVLLNGRVKAFPLGTFSANVLGTCILGMTYDLQHSSAAMNVAGCQVLQGMEDGFCGALTTVSTWVLELDTLRLRHAYIYGLCSLFVSIGFITAIMGPVQWTYGFASPACVT